ncbi:MAG: hypothetical protein U5K69_03865 [Balneolaceae bacterium]|nr:hypothetical protein [Balneolaceae bacterium]
MPDYKLLPKVELHLHLDSSLSFEAVYKNRPDISQNQFRELFVAPPKCKNLPDYLKRVSNQVDLLQTEESLTVAVDTLLQQLIADNVIYAEIRFAPLLHTQQELNAGKVLEIVTDTIQKHSASANEGPEVRSSSAAFGISSEAQSIEYCRTGHCIQ